MWMMYIIGGHDEGDEGFEVGTQSRDTVAGPIPLMHLL